MEVEVNGYSIYFEADRLQPRVGNWTHEVKVRRIIDRWAGRDVVVQDYCIAMGGSEDEAFKKSATCAREWAHAQR